MLRSLSRLIIIQRNYWRKVDGETLRQSHFIPNKKFLCGVQQRLFSTESENVGLAAAGRQQIDYDALNFDEETIELVKTYEAEVTFISLFAQESRSMFAYSQMLAMMERSRKVCDPYLLRREDWDEILKSKSISERRRYYAYQLGKQRKRQKSKVKHMEILPTCFAFNSESYI